MLYSLIAVAVIIVTGFLVYDFVDKTTFTVKSNSSSGASTATFDATTATVTPFTTLKSVEQQSDVVAKALLSLTAAGDQASIANTLQLLSSIATTFGALGVTMKFSKTEQVSTTHWTQITENLQSISQSLANANATALPTACALLLDTPLKTYSALVKGDKTTLKTLCDSTAANNCLAQALTVMDALSNASNAGCNLQ